MTIKIALAGNPNCGKTTLFNLLTGLNQYVGNWPGVTVEKKEGKIKHKEDVSVIDLPGIYSLSPYTLEEVVARNYLIDETPDVILNVIDGTNLERNLYLTTQLLELEIPIVICVNMIDVVNKNGDKIHLEALSKELGCPVVAISALRNVGIDEAINKAIEEASRTKKLTQHFYDGSLEHTLAHIEEACVHDKKNNRWYAIKIFERDQKIIEKLNINKETLAHIEEDIKQCEEELDDDAESIITNARYVYIGSIIKKVIDKKSSTKMTISDKIDRIVTNRILGLPIFAIIMFVVFYVSVSTIGSWGTNWANDGLFGDGWHLFAIGSKEANEAVEEYVNSKNIVDAYLTNKKIDAKEYFENDNIDSELINLKNEISKEEKFEYEIVDEETLAISKVEANGEDVLNSIDIIKKYNYEEPELSNYGIWIPGIPCIVENILNKLNCNEILKALILDGIIAGIGTVLGFVPQLLVLFFFLAFLEACGYMARVAFILDRVFRKFGLSGKSFIPILIGTGCGVPGIMASRTIENASDRRMTIMTTTFIPCSAKTPFIAMIAGAIFAGAWWVAPSSYFLGLFAIICSGIILKKTKLFDSEVSPFVMELPAYHMPTIKTILHSMWERASSFIKKAGTIILLASILIWFLSYFGFKNGSFSYLDKEEMSLSMLANVGNVLKYIFIPIGFGTWQAAVATITGLIAKENIVGTMGILYNGENVYQNLASAFTPTAAYAFLAFNLLCAPCFAAIGAIKREMNNTKWFLIAIFYQCFFAYVVAFVIYNLGNLFLYKTFDITSIMAIVVSITFLFLLIVYKPKKEV